ncbi:hypothetical protein KSF_004710 [Reticulibacter mediterranei]|uniref:Uncharacterized protein n=1 Tax=Reticulibacter mediterranei TaxID=2778369 RepID=A0A8J3IB77_9CHLR|nr:hypothetical protein [Reticulibacter mediterranei]GHO90423.1 hypothetical protein KSF_004710 [Reticulibacter mediterranei]
MNSFALLRASFLPVFMRAGRVGLSLCVLSLVLLGLAPIPAALAAAKVPPARKQIDANVQQFQFLDNTQGFVLGFDNTLWLEHAPFGSVPPGRTLVDRNVAGFQAIDATQVLVEGTDEKLWLEHAPFGNVPPGRTLIDANVAAFQVVPNTNLQQIEVLGTDGNLWLEHAPFGHVPPPRTLIAFDYFKIISFQPLSTTETLILSGIADGGSLDDVPTPTGAGKIIATNVRSFRDFAGHLLVLDNDGNLRLTEQPYGSSFLRIDTNVSWYQFIDAHVYVQSTNGDLWLESQPVPNRIQVDARVKTFQALSTTEVVVQGTDNKLWLEVAPFG